MILLSAHQVEKSYDHRTLFENVSLGIEERDRIGFVGPNGAGKSTLLKILAGEIEADGALFPEKRDCGLASWSRHRSFPKAPPSLSRF